MTRAVLQRLKRGTAGRIDRDDFAIDDGGVGLQSHRGGSHSRVRRRHVLFVTREDVDLRAVLHDQRTIPVELYLVEPRITFGKRRHHLCGHRLDERGTHAPLSHERDGGEVAPPGSMSPDDQPDKDRPTRKDDPEPRDVTDTPPTEPQPVPIRDPRPEGTPEGPYIALVTRP